MNIKQTADASGVSARNIRYYEQAGLLAPARNPENDYRIYTDADVRALETVSYNQLTPATKKGGGSLGGVGWTNKKKTSRQ